MNFQDSILFLLVLKSILFCFSKNVFKVEIISLSFGGPDPVSYRYAAPFADTAVQNLRQNYGDVFEVHHTYVWNENVTSCEDLKATGPFQLADYIFGRKEVKNLTVLITNGCAETVEINNLARELNLLMITSTAADQIIHNRQLSPTWITTSVSALSNYIQLYITIFNMFSWRSIFFVYEQNSSVIYFALNLALQNALQSIPGFTVNAAIIDPQKDVDYEKNLIWFSSVSRICLFFGRGDSFRKLLIRAAQKNMSKPEFVFIGLKPFEEPYAYGEFIWERHDTNDELAKRAFQSAFLVTPAEDLTSIKPQARYLIPEWIRMSKERYNLSNPYYLKPFPYNIGLHASFIMFGQVLNEVLMQSPDFDFANGKALTDLFLNRSFVTDVNDVYVSSFGERRIDLTFNVFNESLYQFQPVFKQEAVGWHIRPMGRINWGNPNNTPTLNEPFCGYSHNKEICQEGLGNEKVVSAASITVVVILTVLGLLLFWKQAKGTTDQRNWWKIKFEDMFFVVSRC